ncbi:MAG: ribosome silencing factor [Chloroflexota bacterium]
MDALEVARTIVNALEDKKAEDILLMDLTGVAPFTDFFVICSGTSERMLKALIHAALDEVREQYGFKTRVEGESLDGWLLADFGDVVLHVFSLDQREYYALAELWHEGKTLLHLQ